MPTYEYQCGSCGLRFEKIQKISDPARVECPRCASVADRLISGGAGLLFKGSGFYTTDYRSKSYKEAVEKETGKDSSSSTAPSGKADAGTGAKKPESKEDSK